MSSVDGLCLPVCPVDVLLKQGHSKDVRDILSKNYSGTGTKTNKLVAKFRKVHKHTPLCLYVCVTCVSVGSIQAGKCNVVLSSISPVDTVINKVQRQTIGPGDLILHNDTSVGAIHPDPSYVGVVTPVWPV